jgi:two-component system response regulator HydG
VALNCAAVPASLIESELFGHVRGAFTDAKAARDGVFVRASGGTLFLDEIGELPAELQPKLLRALQERTVTPVGGEEEISFDARILSATNCDLVERVEQKLFREDLLYRINVVELHVPPLRARGRDIARLAEHFLRRVGQRQGRPPKRLSPTALAKLLNYEWPGNVRELENAMERSVALSPHDEVRVEDLPPRVRSHQPHQIVIAGTDPTGLPSLESLENDYIRHVLESLRGNRTQAARLLGIGRRTLYRRLDRIAKGSTGDRGAEEI